MSKRCAKLEAKMMELYRRGFNDDKIAQEIKQTAPSVFQWRKKYSLSPNDTPGRKATAISMGITESAYLTPKCIRKDKTTICPTAYAHNYKPPYTAKP